MKFLIILLAVVCIAVASAQRPRCRRPERERCADPRNMGRGGRDCRSTEVWWYSNRVGECLRMEYRGCGGNGNRFCTRAECERRCLSNVEQTENV